MYLKLNPYRWFFLSVLFSVVLRYGFNSAIIAYAPILIMSLFVILNELISNKTFKQTHILVVISWIPYVLLAGTIYLAQPFEGRYLTTYSISIIILPIITLVYFRLFFGNEIQRNYKFVFDWLLVFLVVQLIICIGQISTYTFGIGLPVSELYASSGMVTGTFVNANDLATIVLLILFIVVGLEKYFFKKNKYFIWIVALIILVIAGSRSVLFFSLILFILNKTNNFKRLLINFALLSLLIIVFIFLLKFTENNTFMRIEARLSSLMDIWHYGLSSDSSVKVRLSSYLYFIGKLPELGFGSGELDNYFRYSDEAIFDSVDLLFRNPHSLIVEIGYWLGWAGLFFFVTPVLLLFSYSRRFFSLVLILLITSIVPSSVLGNMIFFLLAILSFFDFKTQSINVNLPKKVATEN